MQDTLPIIEDVQICQCGAVTVYCENGSNQSMHTTTYIKVFKETPTPTLNKAYSCNHCINHWGVDLCICGSGEPVEICNAMEECSDNQPAQELGTSKKFGGWGQ